MPLGGIGFLLFRVLKTGKDARFDDIRSHFWKFLGSCPPFISMFAAPYVPLFGQLSGSVGENSVLTSPGMPMPREYRANSVGLDGLPPDYDPEFSCRIRSVPWWVEPSFWNSSRYCWGRLMGSRFPHRVDCGRAKGRGLPPLQHVVKAEYFATV